MVLLKSCVHFLKLSFGLEETDKQYSVDPPAVMHSESRDACPLINSYKQKFLRSRLPQTLFGGVRFAGVPTIGKISQGLLRCLPLLISSLLDVLDNYVRSTNYIGIVFGVVMFALTFIIHLTVNLKCRSTSPSQSPEISKISSLQEEDEIYIKNTCELFSFLFPERKHKVYLVIDPLMYGVLCGLAFVVTSPFNLDLMGYPTGAIVVIYLLTWFSTGTALYSLISRPAPEVAVFRSDDVLGINHLYRAVYMLLLCTATLLLYNTGNWYTDIDPVQYTWYAPVRDLLYALLCVMSLLWPAGVLPPIDCLYSWLLETVSVVFLAASPQPNDARLTLQFLLSLLALLLTYILKTNTATLYFISLSSALISADLCGMVAGLRKGAKFKLQRLAMLGASLVISLVCSVVICQVQKPDTLDSTMFPILQYLIIAAYVVTVLLEHLQTVYLLGIFHNPLLDIWKKTHVRYILQTLHLLLTPLILLLFLLHLVHYEMVKNEYSNQFIAAVMMFRCIRLAWQNTHDSLEECMVFSIVLIAVDELPIQHTLMLFIVGLAVRVAKQWVKRLLTMATLFITFLTVKKQRRICSPWVITANIILLPLTLVLSLFAVVIGAPVLPLFSLPIFILSFPRPLRFWPCSTAETYSGSDDTSYYQQICPEIMSSLTFPSPPVPGSFYLVRVENLLVIVQILEAGYGHYSCIMKGLELQETSCHTEEAGVIKEIFTEAADGSGHYNSHYFNMLSPLSLTPVKTYSDARNVLTGVLDSPDVLQSIKPHLLKSLSYLLVKYYNNIPGSPVYVAEQAQFNTKVTTGFDFSGLSTKPKFAMSHSSRLTSIEMVEDTDNVIKDNVSMDSGNSWIDDDVDDVIVNKAVLTSQPSEHSLTKSDLSKHSIAKSDKASSEHSPSSSIHDAQGKPLPDTPAVLPEGEDWLNLPFTNSLLTKLAGILDVKFYQECRAYFGFTMTDSDSLIPGVSSAHAALVLAISAVIEGDSRSNLTPYQVVKNYQGKFEWNSNLSWLENNPGLRELVIKAYRYAVKLSIDECVYGAASDHEEAIGNLTDLELSWFIGLESDSGWSESVRHSKESLFSLAINEEGQYTSRMLTLSTLSMYVGSLDAEAVRSLWASLALELFYLTNDDEERYSIQAHPYFMRNITVQAADLPLGYPIYQSPLLSS